MNLLPLFPIKAKPVYVNAPSCCGADIYWFPPKFAPAKVKHCLLPVSVKERRLVILLGKHFPRFVDKLCKGVGIIVTEKLRKVWEQDKDKKIKCENVSNDIRTRYDYQGYRAVQPIKANREQFKQAPMSMGVCVTRLADKVYFLDGLFNTHINDVQLVLKQLNKGDVVLAITTTPQERSRIALQEAGLRTVVTTYGQHGRDYNLYLHYMRKNK